MTARSEGLYLPTGCCRLLQAPSPELTGHIEEKQEAPTRSFTFMENTCRVYKDREVLVSSACLLPSGLAPSWGISLCDSPVDELRVLSFFTVSLLSDGKLWTKHRVRKWNYRHKKQMRKKGEISHLYDLIKTGKLGHMWYFKLILDLSSVETSDLSSTFVVFPPSQPPSEEKINGILLGFRIRYRELLYDRLRSYSAHSINSASTWAELNGEPSVQLTWRIQVGS